MLNYHRYKPVHPLLAPFIEEYYQVSGDSSMPVKQILPRAGANMVFHFNNTVSDGSTCFRTAVSGIQDQPYISRPHQGGPDSLLIRLSPAGLSRFTAVPVYAFTNQRVTPELIWGAGTTALYEQLHEQTDANQRITILEQFLLQRFRQVLPADELVIHLASWLKIENESIVFPRLKQLSNLSWRQTERRFKQLIGLDMQTYIRICRFQRAKSLMVDHPKWRLTDVGYTANYYDQAHFSREFKQFSGVRPGKFVACGPAGLAG
ncbi:AraC family transcriptional regulator [Chitinophaga agrisoli]|uniref:AraC family transcriptional regulator n=1 Tax=Chitinophaga agrisoli TaxID=2607653 RepID=A0A5B2VHU5_9BACT|nr:helix-turn-helix domain-containing protein [Chitinophaga agrisoli]KAA2238475.1 AraC family transcriptional regulator [Chitinophaga agrisoli]